MSEPQFRLSHTDFLSLIATQATTVADVANGITRGANVGPDHLLGATRRLTEIVGTWVQAIQQQAAAAPPEASASDKAA